MIDCSVGFVSQKARLSQSTLTETANLHRASFANTLFVPFGQSRLFIPSRRYSPTHTTGTSTDLLNQRHPVAAPTAGNMVEDWGLSIVVVARSERLEICRLVGKGWLSWRSIVWGLGEFVKEVDECYCC